MFHEHREIVSKLKEENAHFKKVFDRHNEINDRLDKAEESGNDHIDPIEVEKMKKEKLMLKDEAYSMIIKYKKDNQ